MTNLMKTCLLLFFACFATLSFAQNAFGGKVGINISNWNGDTEDLGEDFKSNIGLQIGAVAQIGINDMISIQPEIVFIQKGTKSEGEEDFLGDVIKYKDQIIFNYLEVPILVKVVLGGNEGAGFFVTAGPSFGYALSGKTKSEYTINGETEKDEDSIDFDEDDGFARFELSASLGAGVNIPVGPGILFFEARYLLGLSDLDSDEDDFTIKNGGIGIGAGILIRMGQ